MLEDEPSKCLLTIIIPTWSRDKSIEYDRLPNLKRIISSVKNQSDKTFSLIIIDNDSYPEAKEYLKDLEIESTVKLFNKKNIGWVRSLNKAISVVDTKWFTVIQDDDAITEDFVKVCNEKLRNTEEKVIFMSYKYETVFAERGNEIETVVYKQPYKRLDSTSFFKNLLFEDKDKIPRAGIGGFIVNKYVSNSLRLPRYYVGLHSDDYFIRWLSTLTGLDTITEPIYTCRYHVGSTSSRSQKRFYGKMRGQVARLRFIIDFFILWLKFRRKLHLEGKDNEIKEISRFIRKNKDINVFLSVMERFKKKSEG